MQKVRVAGHGCESSRSFVQAGEVGPAGSTGDAPASSSGPAEPSSAAAQDVTMTDSSAEVLNFIACNNTTTYVMSLLTDRGCGRSPWCMHGGVVPG